MSYWDGERWVQDVPAREARPRRSRRLVAAGAEASLITLLVFGLIVGSAFAAKPSRGTIVVPDGLFGDTVTATVNPGGEGVWAYAACLQNGERVYAQYEKVDGSNQALFRLGPTPSWTSGDANCVAQELTRHRNGRWRVVAETTFQATDPS